MRIGALTAGYCERAGEAGFLAEPVNLVTNLAFFAAAFLAACSFRAEGLDLRRHTDIALLIAFAFVIATGSTLWHSLATRWAELLDVIPIMLFILLCLPVMLVRVCGFSLRGACAGLALFLATHLVVVMTVPVETWNGSAYYLPVWLAVALVAAGLVRWRHPFARRAVLAAFLLALALLFRGIDLAVCETLSVGTHFLWHLLNAVVLWLLLSMPIAAAAGEVRGKAA